MEEHRRRSCRYLLQLSSFVPALIDYITVTVDFLSCYDERISRLWWDGIKELSLLYAGIAAYNKSVKVFQKVQTEESLSYYGLRNKRSEALTQYPERLIRLLFEEHTSADRFVAVNKVAENIAQIYDLNLRFLKHAFIQEWLPPIETYQQEDYYAEHHFDANASTM